MGKPRQAPRPGAGDGGAKAGMSYSTSIACFSLLEQPSQLSIKSPIDVEITSDESLNHVGLERIERNPALQYLHEAIQDWGNRLGKPSQRPVCLTCPHE